MDRTERWGALVLLIVSVVAIVLLGDDLLYNAGLIPLLIYTMGVLGLGASVYYILRQE